MGEITNLYRGFQTVVPSKIRKKLNLDLDYILEWTISENNKVEVEFRKKTDFLDLVAMVSNEKKDSLNSNEKNNTIKTHQNKDKIKSKRKKRIGDKNDFH